MDRRPEQPRWVTKLRGYKWVQKIETIDWTKLQDFFNKLPLVNVVVGMVWSKPTFQGLEKMLQIFGLIDALMLATVLSMICSVTFDEMQSAMARYNNVADTSWSFCAKSNSRNPYNSFCSKILSSPNGYAKVSADDGLDFAGNPFAMIYGFPQFSTASLALFTMSLLATVFLYLEGVHAHKQTTDTLSLNAKEAKEIKDTTVQSVLRTRALYMPLPPPSPAPSGVVLSMSPRAGVPSTIDTGRQPEKENNKSKREKYQEEVKLIAELVFDMMDKKRSKMPWDETDIPTAWWGFAAPVCFFAFSCMAAGVVTFFFTSHRMFFIKFPAYLIEYHGTRNDYAWSWQGDPLHTYSSWGYFAICLSLGVIILLLSVARMLLSIFLPTPGTPPEDLQRSLVQEGISEGGVTTRACLVFRA